MIRKRAALFLADSALLILLCYCAYIWASWADPYHEARDRARGYWHLARICWAIARNVGQLAIYAENEYRKATTS